MSLLFFTKERYKDPEYYKALGECDYDCLACRHLDVDCEGDELEDPELFQELFDEDL